MNSKILRYPRKSIGFVRIDWYDFREAGEFD